MLARFDMRREGCADLALDQAGDVGCMRERNRGWLDRLLRQRPYQVTPDETLAQALVNCWGMRKEQALYDPRRHEITNYVYSLNCKLRKHHWVVQKGERVLIYSDGFGDNFTPEEMIQMGIGLTALQLRDLLWEKSDARMRNRNALMARGRHGWWRQTYADGYRMEPKTDNRALVIVDMPGRVV